MVRQVNNCAGREHVCIAHWSLRPWVTDGWELVEECTGGREAEEGVGDRDIAKAGKADDGDEEGDFVRDVAYIDVSVADLLNASNGRCLSKLYCLC